MIRSSSGWKVRHGVSRNDIAAANVVSGRPVRIAHVFGSLDRGGVELRTLDLLRAMAGRNVDFIACVTKPERGSLEGQFQDAGASIARFDLRRWRFSLQLYRFLRTNEIDVLHSHLYFTSGLTCLIAWVARTPVRVAHFHTDGKGRRRQVKYRILDGLVRLFATDVIGVSPSVLTRNIRAGKWYAGRVALIPNGFPISEFSTERTRSLRRELGITDAASILVHVGRADIPTKNRSKAVGVLRACVDAGLDGHLVFVGRDGRSESECDQHGRDMKRLIADLGLESRVHLLGERSNVPSILQGADMLLCTSTLEGLPSVVIEARACGLPVVASRLPGIDYIASIAGGVITADPGGPDDVWARLVIQALSAGYTQEARQAAHDALKGGPFDVTHARERFDSVWRRNVAH